MTASSAEDIRDYLVNTSVVAGANAFVGALPPTPDIAITTLVYGGTDPVIAMGDRNVLKRVDYVQILIRGAMGGFASSSTMADAIYSALAFKIHVTIGSHVYDMFIPTSAPIQLLSDNSNRPVFSLNIEAWRRGL